MKWIGSVGEKVRVPERYSMWTLLSGNAREKVVLSD